MQSLISLLRLGVGGMLLEPQAYREQRDSERGVRRGLLLVLLVSLLVSVAGLIGSLAQSLAQPSPEQIVTAIYDGVRGLPWYAEQVAANPGFAAGFDASFESAVANVRLLTGSRTPADGLTQLLLAPIIAPLAWLIGGAITHLVARALGGRGTLAQTLSTTALAAGVGLLNLVLIVPFARSAGTLLLGMLATYVAIRVAHGLSPWRSFWATLLPSVIVLLLALLFACGLIVVLSSIGALLSGV